MTVTWVGEAADARSLGGDPNVVKAGSTLTALAVDDLMLAVGNVSAAQTFTTPGGWAAHPQSLSASKPLLFKFADAADVAAASFGFVVSGSANAQMTVSAYRGVDTSNPWAGTAGVVSTSSTTMTIAAANASVACYLAHIVAKLTVTTFTPPAAAAPDDWDHGVNSLGSTAGADESVGSGSTGTRVWTAAAGASAGIGYIVPLRAATVAPHIGTFAGSVTASGSASGSRASIGTAAGTVSASGAASGSRASRGVFAGTAAASGSAAGSRASRGTFAGSVTASGAAQGSARHSGSFAGSVTASGQANSTTRHSGSFAGSVTTSGTAFGSNGANSFLGTVTTSGTAYGSTRRIGSFSGSVTASGSAAGTRRARGSFAGSVSSSGSASGHRRPRGTFLGSIASSGAASGRRHPRSSLSGHMVTSAQGTGSRHPRGLFSGTATAGGIFRGRNRPPAQHSATFRDLSRTGAIDSDGSRRATAGDRSRTATIRGG